MIRLRGISARLFFFRANPLMQGLQVDDPRMVPAHRETIESNPILLWIYRRRYEQIAAAVSGSRKATGPILEVGCGPSFLETLVPGLIKSDVVHHKNVHAVVDAHSLPYDDASLFAVCLTDVLHHLRHPERFLAEVDRCLQPGGKLVMIEPSNSWLQKFVTNRASPHEYCDDSRQSWENDVTGRLSHANNSIPWMIFVRDREKFERLFPLLRILRIRRSTLLAYYLSGGVNYRPFLPASCTRLVQWFERLSTPLHRWMGFEMFIELEKLERTQCRCEDPSAT